MGIKFLCPNGHKLHVKSFLSGKKAICPKCGVRVVVPEDTSATEGGEESAEEDSLAENSDFSQSATDTQPLGTQAQPAGGATSTSDPLAEAPTAVWYVRPPTGGQYGPASGEIMRGWIEDGRVGASSLVWRAGWSEWRSAAATFPQLRSQLTTPGQPLPADMAATATQPILPRGQITQTLPPSEPESDAGERAPAVSPLAKMAIKRRRRHDVSFMFTAGLIVVSVILVIVLLIVVWSRSTPVEPAANAQSSRPVVTPSRNSELTPISIYG